MLNPVAELLGALRRGAFMQPMSDSVLLRAPELMSRFDAAGVTLKSLVNAVLECSPVDVDGNAVPWPATSQMRVRHLVKQLVRSPQWPDQPPVPGLNVMSTVVAEKAAHIAMFLRGDEGATMLMTSAQVEEIFKAAAEFVKPRLDELVAPLLKHSPAADGFFSSYVGAGVEGIEVNLGNACLADDKRPVRRIADEPFEGRRLVAWRYAHPRLADAGERVTDSHAVLFDASEKQAGYVRLRHVWLCPQTASCDLVYILDAYDAEGLELGFALKEAVRQGSLDELDIHAGLPLLQVLEAEVRQDLRGQGLGMRLLRRALNLSVKGLRPQPALLTMAIKPMQYDFPLKGLPADTLLDALDATATLHQYVERNRPQDAVRSLLGTDILYLGVDARATGTHFEQLALLAEERYDGSR